MNSLNRKAERMARIFQTRDEYRQGSLVLGAMSKTDCIEVFYIPSREKLEQSKLCPDKASEYRVKLLEIDSRNGRLTILPINTLAGHDKFLKPKYNQIERITLADGKPVLSVSVDDLLSSNRYFRSLTFGPTQPFEEDVLESDIADVPKSTVAVVDILESLPPGFTKDYEFGLGLAKPYRFIVDAVEDLSNCIEIVISEQHCTEVNQQKKVFYISTQDFETIRKSLNQTTDMSQIASLSVKKSETYNFFAEKLGRPEIPVNVGRHRLRKLFTTVLKRAENTLSDDEQEDVLGVIAKNVKSIAETKPEKLASLQSDIELVNLEVLITSYETMLTARHNESDWQNFLNTNPFILGLAFGYPIIKVQDQASVGGRKLSGRGEKFTDFLVKNSMTNNTAIVEIKTPRAKLLNDKSYRDEVFTPSASLSGSINQALDQKYRLEREITQIKENSQIYDIRSYSVHCCLIIGTMPNDETQRKSFELFRRNSKYVEIITFDELLQKLKNLKDFLSSPQTEGVIQPQSIEVPF